MKSAKIHPLKNAKSQKSKQVRPSDSTTPIAVTDRNLVGKPPQIEHDPKRTVGKLGDLNDYKQTAITKDGSYFTRHYYFNRDGSKRTWFWYDIPLIDRDVIAKLKTAPNCKAFDDNCDGPSIVTGGQIDDPPYVDEKQDCADGTVRLRYGVPHGVRGSMSSPTRASHLRASLRIRRRSSNPKRDGSRPR